MSSDQLAFWCRQVDDAGRDWRALFRDWECTPGDASWESTDAAVALACAWAGEDKFGQRPEHERLAIITCLSQSEALDDHELAITLSTDLADDALTALLKERHEVIRQYRRFPARNRILGRASTPAEAYFMTTAGQHFR